MRELLGSYLKFEEKLQHRLDNLVNYRKADIEKVLPHNALAYLSNKKLGDIFLYKDKLVVNGKNYEFNILLKLHYWSLTRTLNFIPQSRSSSFVMHLTNGECLVVEEDRFFSAIGAHKGLQSIAEYIHRETFEMRCRTHLALLMTEHGLRLNPVWTLFRDGTLVGPARSYDLPKANAQGHLSVGRNGEINLCERSLRKGERAGQTAEFIACGTSWCDELVIAWLIPILAKTAAV